MFSIPGSHVSYVCLMYLHEKIDAIVSWLVNCNLVITWYNLLTTLKVLPALLGGYIFLNTKGSLIVRIPLCLKFFCSQRLGNRSGDRFNNRFGNRVDGAEGAASFLTCLVFKTVYFFFCNAKTQRGLFHRFLKKVVNLSC